MTFKSVTLNFFRNYSHLEVFFHPKLNIICGDNAQGKTNLLEALSYLSGASSHRARYDKELIQFEMDYAFLKGEVNSRQRDFTLEIELSRHGRRKLHSNGVKLKNIGELSQIINTIFFCPDDLFLIRAGATERRRFLDDCICQLRPKYAAALTEFKRLYEHKTRILRDCIEYPSLLDTLDDFSLRMAQTGAIIIHYRAHFVRKLLEFTPLIHQDFSGGREKINLVYKTISNITDPLASTKQLFNQLLSHQEEHRQAELDCRQCLSGPHKDDLEIELEGRSAKQFASQGQTRTAALSLKLASREIFYFDTGQWPILLLDDVLSELDQKRQDFVLSRINGGQVFITYCEDDKIKQLKEGKIFYIKNGSIL